MRKELTTADGRTLSYLDFTPDSTGRPLLALHGHLSEGASFAHLAEALGPEWRVIAPDQRGHGDSDRAPDYRREGYVADALALLDHLGLDRVVLAGHSLGAINAYHLTAARPDRFAGLISIDTAAELPETGTSPLAFVLGLPYTAPTREELVAACGPLGPMIAPALRPHADGWRLPFHPQDTVDSENLVHGDHWAAWLAADCPALLVHGTDSQVLTSGHAADMTARRPRTTLVELATDHFVQLKDPAGLEKAVREFLAGL
ncbi:pimeloyl-ACP methyl ester carboxylesterase [Streptomyces sp. PanSC19]|uniref:alpha/beta fold hydrolase n=1 Tax=Streptomyces sp. PanSC19 TaxID=1520455 RepID=UPI000F4AD476|nr:alpha/beta hydrolase [Streptomyces sp. PanSC19]ROQ33351.1 pimeloyl-ACP methyl ester carboxylesterase [Streptomyces sp. PanSC19]